tara:strand:+ start:377 stop:607 length:231 start_codon:yes stop_codon:yes gene_type:complete
MFQIIDYTYRPMTKELGMVERIEDVPPFIERLSEENKYYKDATILAFEPDPDRDNAYDMALMVSTDIRLLSIDLIK